jgi:TM2 domain-containing membrane protein YozV
MTRPQAAGLLSFIVPGIGQFYNGDILRGLFWLVITPGFWIGSGGLLGWVCHLASAYTAHERAKELEGVRPVRVAS